MRQAEKAGEGRNHSCVPSFVPSLFTEHLLCALGLSRSLDLAWNKIEKILSPGDSILEEEARQ